MIEVGKKYVAKNGNTYECIAVICHGAYMIGGQGQAAYVWHAQTGKSRSLGLEYDLIPATGFQETAE